jgi:hypothetical protein
MSCEARATQAISGAVWRRATNRCPRGQNGSDALPGRQSSHEACRLPAESLAARTAPIERYAAAARDVRCHEPAFPGIREAKSYPTFALETVIVWSGRAAASSDAADFGRQAEAAMRGPVASPMTAISRRTARCGGSMPHSSKPASGTCIPLVQRAGIRPNRAGMVATGPCHDAAIAGGQGDVLSLAASS